MLELDVIDKKILFELDRDSRQPISQLSKKIRLGRDRIIYRMDRLRERGIILKCCALIDPYKLGFSFSKTYLKLSANREKRRSLERFLENHERTYWLAECDGAWDLIWCTLSTDSIDFRGIQSSVFAKFHDIILSFDISVNTQVNVFYKNFLLGKGNGGRVLGGQLGRKELSPLDVRLLWHLGMDSRCDLSYLARELDCSPLTVRKHLEDLEHDGIISGYRVDIDLSKIGMTFFKAQIFTKSFRKDEELQLEGYCDRHPHITHYIRQLGSCIVELEVDAFDYPHFHQIIRELCEAHSKFIRNSETILVRRESYRWPFRSSLFDAGLVSGKSNV